MPASSATTTSPPGVVTYLLSVAPQQLVQPLVPEIRSILTVPRTGLLSLSALLTIWSAMGGVDSVRVGLNRAYDLRETRSTSGGSIFRTCCSSSAPPSSCWPSRC